MFLVANAQHCTGIAELTKTIPDSRGIQAGPGTTEPQPNVCYTVNRAGRNRIVLNAMAITNRELERGMYREGSILRLAKSNFF